MQTHRFLPGINGGDIGPKLGFSSVDNGYLKFKHFRQPRDSLLAKYVQVTDDGTFKTIGGKNSTKIAFGSMLNTRISLIFMAPYYLSRQATIATRYSFLRRQFPGKDTQ
jgi:acyl-CoA oxidase